MGYNYLNNVELDTALKLYLEAISKSGLSPKVEEISVTDALGRITAEAVYAKISSPHYNACAMDGIAVRARDTFGATETTPAFLKEGHDFSWVDTGDPLPEEADAVVMVEDVIQAGEGTIKLLNAATPWQHVRQIGEDICAGEMVLASNTKIEPAAIGALLAAGVTWLLVRQKALVGLIPTGDELVPPSDHPPEGKILEFNSAVFSAMLTGWGASPRIYAMTPDNLGAIIEIIKQASAECDMVIVNAGSSAGREDFTAKAIGAIGEVLVHG
ncbi:MAG TPA: molybdopterin-binding protein, partial [Bacillota bacterium]|nr:molybdopterin-binding protein [Bacillota bacterium]